MQSYLQVLRATSSPIIPLFVFLAIFLSSPTWCIQMFPNPHS